MIRAIFCIAILLIAKISHVAFAEPPKKPLFLTCGPHLVAISTSFTDKIKNMDSPEGGRHHISADVRTLYKNKDVGGPIDMTPNWAWAFRDVFRLGGKTLDRISGKLTWKEQRRRPKDPAPAGCTGMFNPGHNATGESCDHVTEVILGEHDCKQSTLARLNTIILNHNSKYQEALPERKF